MEDRNTLEQDIDEVLGPLAAAGASPREIDWEPTPEPVQAFEDMRDLPEEPEENARYSSTTARGLPRR